jgi:hypothetical protein
MADGGETELETATVNPTVMRRKVDPDIAIPVGWPTFTLR